MKNTRFLILERRIAAGDRGGVVDRWRYGRALLDAKLGRKQLPHGLLDQLIQTAARTGITLTKVEIQRRIRCAEAYDTEAKVRRSATHFGGWWALVKEDFPPVEHDGTNPDDLAAAGLGDAPDSWEQLQLDIPGLKPVITVRGRTVRLVRGEDGAKVADVAAYLQMCEQMHANFGKTVDQTRSTLQTMREGCGGDETTNAVEAWEAGTADSSDLDTDTEFTIAGRTTPATRHETADRTTPIMV